MNWISYSRCEVFALLHGALCLRCVVLLCGWCICTQSAIADWTYVLGVDTQWVEVSEHDGATQLVEEQGFLQGMSGSVVRIDDSWRYGIDGGYRSGSLAYDGETQLGAPLETDTDWQNSHIGVSASRQFGAAGSFRLGGNFEVEWRDRDIAATAQVPGLRERYQTLWMGVHASVAPLKSVAITADLGCAIDSTVDVSFDTNLDRASLSVGEHCRVGVMANLDVGKRGSTTWYVQPFVNWERYPRTDSEVLTSGGVEVGRVYLPETEFLTLGITIGIRESMR